MAAPPGLPERLMTPVQLRMARAALKLGVRELAALAGVAANTVSRFENGSTEAHPRTLLRLQAVLERRGVAFLPGRYGQGPGVRLDRVDPYGIR